MNTVQSSPAELALEQAMRLDAQLCFAVHAASRAFDSVYRVTLREAGLTYPQYLVLLVLWEHGEVSVKELGQRLRLDSGTLSPLLKRMEAAGWVERRRDPADERSVVVRATEEGLGLRERICVVPERTVESTGMTVMEMGELRDRLKALTNSLDAAVLRMATDSA
ncbi:MAG TPA: MarR family transcriptional regulator [Actinospica sp.]|nr:MarR family transcriptional regulator [Actinospica sp.]